MERDTANFAIWRAASSHLSDPQFGGILHASRDPLVWKIVHCISDQALRQGHATDVHQFENADMPVGFPERVDETVSSGGISKRWIFA